MSFHKAAAPMPYLQKKSPNYHVCGLRDCEKQEEEWGEKSSVLCI